MTLRRLLGLLVGLVYRLIVLVLFERWIPFPERPAAQQSKPVAARPWQRRAVGSAAERARPAAPARPPIFDVRLAEPAPERVAALESEHLHTLALQSAPRAAQEAHVVRPLRALLRDKRALRSALVLGEAVGAPRFRRK